MDIEKCKKCRYAYFELSTVGGRIINGKKYDIVEKSEIPSSCGYGLDGARGISENDYCPKPNRKRKSKLK